MTSTTYLLPDGRVAASGAQAAKPQLNRPYELRKGEHHEH